MIDDTAVTSWVERYQKPLFGFVMSLSSAGRERAFQTTVSSFAGVLRSFSSAPRDDDFRRALFRTAVAECRALPAPAAPDFSGDGSLPAQVRSGMRLLKQAVFSLSFDNKCLLLLRDGQHLAYEDMAAILQRPVKEIKLNVLSAREMLQVNMTKLLRGGP